MIRAALIFAATCVPAFAQAPTTVRVSVDSGGIAGNAHSADSSISADGRVVAFAGAASNLVVGDTNATWDVFVHVLQNGTTERVSVSSAGVEGNAASGSPSLSGDGRFVAFVSVASGLVAGDSNAALDVFVRDRLLGTTERVSVSSTGVQGNLDSGGDGLAISADGRFVAFDSVASSLVPNDGNGQSDVFVRDRLTGTTEIVSLSTGGAPGNQGSFVPSISADGRFVAFVGQATNLVAGDTNARDDVFVRDRHAGTTERVSLGSGGAEADDSSESPTISADGRFVAFPSWATNLVSGDTNATIDGFVRDRVLGTTERVSVDSTGAQGNSHTVASAISADGRFVAFRSYASNLVGNDTNGDSDVFVRDRQTGSTELASLSTGGLLGDGTSYGCSISADGRGVSIDSQAANLVPGDTTGWVDVFLRDRGPAPIVASCFGDGTGVPCPCGNGGLLGHGCENSAGTGGALLTAAGTPSLSADSLQLAASGATPEARGIFLQSRARIAPAPFGDGLRCIGGALERLYVVRASGGVATAPPIGQASVSARSAARGDPIPMGATRHYQTYYRDPAPTFCPSPAGNSWNVTNALSAVWSP